MPRLLGAQGEEGYERIDESGGNVKAFKSKISKEIMSSNNESDNILWNDLYSKYGMERPRKSGRFKLIAVSAVLVIIILSSFAYSFVSSIDEMKFMTLNWLDETKKVSDNVLKNAKETTAKSEADAASILNDCKKENCSIGEVFSGYTVIQVRKYSEAVMESTQTLFDWHKQKLDGEILTSDCAGFSKSIATVLSVMMGIADVGRGYNELSGKIANNIGELRQEIESMNLSGSPDNAEFVKNKAEQARADFWKEYSEELKQSYAKQKDAKTDEISEFSKNILEEVKKEQKYDAAKDMYVNICMSSINSQFVSYHKEFIEYAYSGLEKLSNQGKYEETAPYAVIISGFLSTGE